MSRQQLTICDGHQHYPTPLIWTLAFVKAERWCPYCGAIHSMLWSGIEVPATTELQQRLVKYTVASEDFLYAVGSITAPKINWKDNMISPDRLPAEEKARIKQILEKGWKYNAKIEEYDGQNN